MADRGHWLLLVLLVGVAGVGACAPAPLTQETHSDGRLVMGTVLEIELTASTAEEPKALLERAFREAAELESLMSRYRDDSPIHRLNRGVLPPDEAQDPRLIELLGRSIELASLSRGSFDVTVGALVELWEQASRRDRLPTDAEIEEARRRTGIGNLRLAAGNRIALEGEGLRVDLGGIAKGYALDRIVASLPEDCSALLQFGQSSGWARGQSRDATPWTLLLRAPNGGAAGIVALRDTAYSVSSTFGRWSEIQGQRFGHVVDPRSGWPVRREALVAVIAPSATLAEALSTALIILGPDEGMALVEEFEEVEALFLNGSSVHEGVTPGGGAPRRRMSRGWREATGYREIPPHAEESGEPVNPGGRPNSKADGGFRYSSLR